MIVGENIAKKKKKSSARNTKTFEKNKIKLYIGGGFLADLKAEPAQGCHKVHFDERHTSSHALSEAHQVKLRIAIFQLQI